MLLLASVREGWGWWSPKQNALGTPAVAYDVPGLRDSIRHDQTGLLTQASPDALADAMTRLWVDHSLYKRCRRELSCGAQRSPSTNDRCISKKKSPRFSFEAHNRPHFKAQNARLVVAALGSV